MTKRVAYYAGVSTRTGGQTVEKQLRDLRAGADRLGRAVVATITNEGASGAKGRDRRPGSDALLRAVTRREVELVAAWSVCRLGRGLKDLVGFLAEVEARGLGVYLHAQALDSTTPAGPTLFQMLAIFSEFERVRAGLARPQGRRCGRPPVDRAREKKGRELLGRGPRHRQGRQGGVRRGLGRLPRQGRGCGERAGVAGRPGVVPHGVVAPATPLALGAPGSGLSLG